MHILIFKMAVREGFEPSMQLLTAYSLSRGAPSASRPSHQNIMTLLEQQNHNVWRTYYVLQKISQTFFCEHVLVVYLVPNITLWVELIHQLCLVIDEFGCRFLLYE